MSTCISQHGEYSSHKPDDTYTCKLCGALDEDGLIAELTTARAEVGRLSERLRLAEIVCTIFSWTGSHGRSERDDAVLQAWMDWTAVAGTPSPSAEWDERVADLAARRREIRERTLAKIRGEQP